MPGAAVMLWVVLVSTAAADYDPLKTDGEPGESHSFVIRDAQRKREIPVRMDVPPGSDPSPIVIFSHGLGGTRDGSRYLGKHWAARGYVVVFIQHPGSDESVWRGKRLGERMAAMREAASLQNFQLRVQDVRFLIDQFEEWNRSEEQHVRGRLDHSRIGMSGHSFGANTTQAVSGQSFGIATALSDPRILAAIPMSPSIPRRGDPRESFAKVQIPWLCMTGTEDTSVIGESDAKARREVFASLPKGRKYELVLEKGEHSAFTDRALPGDKERRNPNHHRAILATSTAFWDAYLKQDRAAREWLDRDAVRSCLEQADLWSRK